MSEQTAQMKPEPQGLPTPEDVAKGLLKRLPEHVASILLTVLSLFSWVSLPINFLSQLAQFDAVVKFYQACIDALAGLGNIIDAVVSWFAPIIHAWREFIAPVEAFVLQYVPGLPPLVLDYLLIVGLAVPPVLQRWLAWRGLRSGHRVIVQALERVKSRTVSLDGNATEAARLLREMSLTPIDSRSWRWNDILDAIEKELTEYWTRYVDTHDFPPIKLPPPWRVRGLIARIKRIRLVIRSSTALIVIAVAMVVVLTVLEAFTGLA